jgi:hypothetical protein
LNSISGSPMETMAGDVDMVPEVSHAAGPHSREDDMADDAKPNGPDLTKGVSLADLADGGMLVGHAGDDEVLLARRSDEVFAVSAHCSHYHGPLAKGCWSATRCAAPGITPASACAPASRCTRRRSGRSTAGRSSNATARSSSRKSARPNPHPTPRPASLPPGRIVIVGGGAAGFAAAEMLRRQDYQGSIVMLSDDDAAPVDRPNLSKDYLAGTAPEEWVPLRGDDFYAQNGIELRLKAHAAAIDLRAREVTLGDGGQVPYDRLLLATARSPCASHCRAPTCRTSIPCARWPTAAPSSSGPSRRSARVVIGASFIGLEVAASLRARELEVHVVAPEKAADGAHPRPGDGRSRAHLHEEHGVVFHLEDSPVAIEAGQVS